MSSEIDVGVSLNIRCKLCDKDMDFQYRVVEGHVIYHCNSCDKEIGYPHEHVPQDHGHAVLLENIPEEN